MNAGIECEACGDERDVDCQVVTPRPQHRLNFFPLPHGYGSLRPTFCRLAGGAGSCRSAITSES